MKYGFETALLAVGTFLALLGAAFAHDNLFQAHMWVLFAVLLGGTIIMVRRVSFAPYRVPGNGARQGDGNPYFDEVIKYGVIATVFWGVVGFLVGVVIAAQLAFPDLNLEPWLNFGRLRPLHTRAVIFAFGGNALIVIRSTSSSARRGRACSAGISAGSCSGASSS